MDRDGSGERSAFSEDVKEGDAHFQWTVEQDRPHCGLVDEKEAITSPLYVG
jgi:hypothetical protein